MNAEKELLWSLWVGLEITESGTVKLVARRTKEVIALTCCYCCLPARTMYHLVYV